MGNTRTQMLGRMTAEEIADALTASGFGVYEGVEGEMCILTVDSATLPFSFTLKMPVTYRTEVYRLGLRAVREICVVAIDAHKPKQPGTHAAEGAGGG